MTGQNHVTAADVKNMAGKFGADLTGIASIERFRNVPENENPEQIFPETRSVIVIGRRIARGSLRGIEEGTQFGLYNLYGYDWLENRFLASATYNLAEFLEDSGYEAVPVQNLPKEIGPTGLRVADGRAAPNVLIDFDRAAVRAGLGEIDYGGFLLTPEFGTRQRVQIVLTDAELRPDPLCEKTLCDFQDKYSDFCPLDAIDPGGETTLGICGKKMRVAGIDFETCRECGNGAVNNRYYPEGPPDRIAAACGRSVYAELERRGKIERGFRTAFRKRPVWNRVGNRVELRDGK